MLLISLLAGRVLIEEEGDLPDTLLPMLNRGRETGTLLILRY